MPFAVSVVNVSGPLDEVDGGDVTGAGSRPGRVGWEVRNPYPASGSEVRSVST